jgi:hypothetical protein
MEKIISKIQEAILDMMSKVKYVDKTHIYQDQATGE